MKIQSLSDKLFSIGGVSYPKGDFIPEYNNTNYVDGVVDQYQSDPVVNLINKATGVPMFKASLKWNQFKNSSGVVYANFNALQSALATIIVGNFASIGPTGPTGPQGPAGPAGLNWKGPWVSGTSYVVNDSVGYGGASYFCILATSGTTTPDLDTTKWALLASQGAVGPAGPVGATGATGPQGDVGPGATQTLAQTIATGNLVPFNTVWNENGGGDNLILNADGIKFSNEFDADYGIFTKGSMFYSDGSTYISASLPTTIVGANKTILFPDASGTVALTSDVTLQKAYNGGNTVVSGNLKTGIFDSTTGLSVENTSTLSKTTLETTKITLAKNASGLKTTNILQSLTPTANRTIYFPDSDGTIALQKYKSYVAQIIPESSSVVTTNVLENTLDTTVTVSWVSGKINIVLGSNLITLTNPYLSASNYLQNDIYHVITPSLLGFDTIELASYKVSGTPSVGWSYGGRINFELRLYN